MEADLASTRTALEIAEAERRRDANGTDPRDPPINALMKTLIESVSAASLSSSAGEASGPRDWKPPTWDGRADTFRDYLVRLKSSYRVRSAVKPTLSVAYYWDTVYDTLPMRERARMRHFWERGSPTFGKDPEAFFAQLENVFADNNEQAKALERLTNLKHSLGQPWHEHQLEFDGLLLSAGGESWSNAAKIGYLRNTFSDPVRTHTASMAKRTDYYEFAEEVERIMTNLEETDQFKAANKKWREKNKDSGSTTTVTTRSLGSSTVTRVDADGDTIMAPARTGGDRGKSHGDRKNVGGKQRAKWVDAAERERRRGKRLCFRCGAAGHRIRECPYAPAVPPTIATINAAIAGPVLEDDNEESVPAGFELGKD